MESAGLEKTFCAKKELLRVKTQRDILKKTLGILSTPSDNDLSA